MTTFKPSQTMRQISFTLGSAGLVVGFVIALGLLSGDAEGRVNLLYLLILFAFLPVLGLLLSLVFMLRQAGKGLSGWILELPLWPGRFHRELLAVGNARDRKFWLLYQTQVVALGFGFGGMLAFLLLLLGSDISFVWRSTLLVAPDLLPVLRGLAIPWGFWQAAQPQLELLQQSQDFRLATPQYTAAMLGQWWKYAFAAQCTYNLLPRLLMLFIARSLYRKSRLADAGPAAQTGFRESLNIVPMQGHLAPVVSAVPEDFLLIDWAGVPAAFLPDLEQALGSSGGSLRAGPLSTLDQEHLDRLSGQVFVVIVKAWEPPMGELADYLGALDVSGQGQGLLLPLDWDSNSITPVSESNLLEWRRFCGTLENWSILQSPVGERT